MKTTKKHFDIFKKECQKWIKVFGILGWRFYFQHEDVYENSLAYCIFPNRIEDRVFTIGLTLNIDYDFSVLDFKRSAFHEVMESLLFRISYLAKARYLNSEDVDEEIHHLIRTFENAVFDHLI